MKEKKGTDGGEKRPPVIHMTEEDAEDLQQFRALVQRLGPKERHAFILRMLAKPDTP